MRLRDRIVLHCPDCEGREVTSRSPGDPDRATVMVIICPECDDGDFHSPIYLDDEGNEVMFDE